MSDLIDRQAVLKICRRYWHPTFNPIMEDVEKLPSAQPELLEHEAYIRGFEQGRTQGMIDAQERKK